MKPSKIKRRCPYCNTDSPPSREHVIPETLGGRVRLPKSIGICTKCNNGVLSIVDRELCNRSYLSVVASREIDESFWHAWDIDHRDGNVFVEARPLWRDGHLRSYICYPQITFDRTGPHLRGDATEVAQFGFQEFQNVIFTAARRCFQEYSHGKKGRIHFEKVPLDLIDNENRFPPRVFFRQSIDTIARKRSSSCVLRFCTEHDKRLAIRELAKLDGTRPGNTNWTVSPSSRLPRFAIAFDIGDTLRCMIKIGLNLLAHISADISTNRFAIARQIVSGATNVTRDLIEHNGFVHPEDLSFLNVPPKCHKFRISYDSGHWTLFSAYFGGAVGTVVRFLGENNESWRTAEFEMPLATGLLAVTKYSIALPYKLQTIEWTNSRAICPSVELISSESQFQIVVSRKKSASDPRSS